MRILVMLMMMLWMNVASAATWEDVDGKGYLLDTSSIKVIQVGYDAIAKANTMNPTKDNGIMHIVWCVNIDTKMYTWQSFDSRDANGTSIYKKVYDVRGAKWYDGSDNVVVIEMLKRVP
jgi:hypothetical protein